MYHMVCAVVQEALGDGYGGEGPPLPIVLDQAELARSEREHRERERERDRER